MLPTGAWLRLRIGVRHPGLEARLARLGLDSWAFLHAVNPGSVQQSPEANAQSHRALAEALTRSTAAQWHQGLSRADAGDWPDEAGYLVLGLELAAALDLGRGFGQLAIVAGQRGSPAALHPC